MSPDAAWLDVHGLRVHYPLYRGLLRRKVGEVRAVNGVSFQVRKGETLGIAGETGSGKTTVAKCIVGLVKPTAGSILLNGIDLVPMKGEELRSIRKQVQMIFQDPYASLNPLMKVGKIVAEPLRVHGMIKDRGRLRTAAERALELVRLDPEMAGRYAHELSGGQRQRVAIARALVVEPSLVICDEPLSALDAFTQSEIIDLLLDLQERLCLTYLFISHDLAAIRVLSDVVAVMYLGEVVELAGRDELFVNPLHPYTQALISAVPSPNPLLERSQQRIVLRGEMPSPLDPPPGCKFNPRCPLRIAYKCDREEPSEVTMNDGRFVRCHLYPLQGS